MYVIYLFAYMASEAGASGEAGGKLLKASDSTTTGKRSGKPQLGKVYIINRLIAYKTACGLKLGAEKRETLREPGAKVRYEVCARRSLPLERSAWVALFRDGRKLVQGYCKVFIVQLFWFKYILGQGPSTYMSICLFYNWFGTLDECWNSTVSNRYRCQPTAVHRHPDLIRYCNAWTLSCEAKANLWESICLAYL